MMNFTKLITCIDSHTAGEPLRIITSGFPRIEGNTMLEKRKYVKENLDDIRSMLMLEPRGHSGMYGCIITEAVTDDGDFGVLFTHNEGLSTMCGHGIIGVTKVAIETGLMIGKDGINTVKIDSPAGRITAFAHVKDGKVSKVSFENVPSFVYKENIKVNVDGIGEVTADIAFGGAFYVYIDGSELNLDVHPSNMEELVKKGMEIKYKVMDEMNIVHPLEPGLNGIYGTIITGPLTNDGKKIISNNVCIFADGQIDRSPTGTGTAGRVALLHHKGSLKEDMILINKSIIDTVFEGKINEKTKVSNLGAVIPEVSGTAYITGFNNILLDPDDPLKEGFRIIGG